MGKESEKLKNLLLDVGSEETEAEAHYLAKIVVVGVAIHEQLERLNDILNDIEFNQMIDGMKD